MDVVSVIGRDPAERAALVERLAGRLGEQGSVATATARSLTDRTGGRESGNGAGVADYSLADDGWSVRGEQYDLGDLLDHLAPKYDFAVLEGFDGADVPTVVLDDRDHTREAVYTADTAAAVDVGDVVEELGEAEPFETLGSLVARAKRSPDAEKSGAIATFTGRVRAKEDDDAFTEHLEFERYDEVATERLAIIKEELEARNGVFEVLLHHRTGVVEYGEDIVFVVVLAGHREEAFRTVQNGINRLKSEVPLFKKEVTVEDKFWVHQ